VERVVLAEEIGRNGGDGANASLVPGVPGIPGADPYSPSASTTGAIVLTHTATGGTGGGSHSGVAGAAGNAESLIPYTNYAASSLSVTSTAIGGKGGSGTHLAGGANGGSARAVADIKGESNTTAIAHVNFVQNVGFLGGGGGDSNFNTGAHGGNGFSVTGGGLQGSTARAESRMGGTAKAELVLAGGAGGGGRTSGGNGGNAAATNAVSGSTSGTLVLVQEAFGGVGGTSSGGVGGTGGTATSLLTHTNQVANLDGTVKAEGGKGGGMQAAGTPGNGGNATATIDLTNESNVVWAKATAEAGVSGNGSPPSLVGVAEATARATTLNGFLARAHASAFGRKAIDTIATSRSTTSGGAISSMSLLATATDNTSLNTETVAQFTTTPTFTLSQHNARGYTVGLPSNSSVTSALSGNPNVTAAYNASATKTPLALLAMGFDTTISAAATQTLTTTADYSFDLGMLTSGNLMIGLLDPGGSGPGFTSLHYTVTREGSLVEDQTFASLASALSYFDDHVLNLGAMASGVVGTLDLSISLSMDSPDNNTSFGTTLLIADIGPTANPPGDYNDDNIVDAADYITWRKHNNTATTLPNDTTSGSVNDGDLTVWRSHFGQTAVSGSGGGFESAAAPEPATGALLLLASLVAAASRRTRR
jgi:hypothetical protein